MSDTSLGPLDLPPPVPNTYNPIFSTSGMRPGMVVATTATPNTVAPADASDATTARFVGMFLGPAPSTAGERGNTRYVGIVALQAAEWIEATEEGTVLDTGKLYYVSATDPGKITKTVPVAEGDASVQVGKAMSPLSILVQANEGIAGPPGPTPAPTVERVTPAGGPPHTGVIDPTIDVTYIEGTGAASLLSLADGTTDGFPKTIYGYSTDGGIRVTPTHFTDGTSITIASGEAGGFILRWDATAASWALVGQGANLTLNP